MRTAKFTKDVLHAIAYLLDLDPKTELETFPATRIFSAINTRAKEAWEDLRDDGSTIYEERAFRQVWFNTVPYAAGTEVYYPTTGLYYSALVDTAAGDLPSDGTKFAVLGDPMDKYIELDQFGKQAIGEVLGIWTANPRTNSAARQVSFQPGPYGVDVASWAGPTVWVEFLARPSEFGETVYDAAATYARDNIVYNSPDIGGDGECYVSLVDGNHGIALTDTTKWLWQPMPYNIAGYVKYAAASDCTDDSQDKATWRADAESALGVSFDRQSADGKQNKYRMSRGCGGDRELAGYCESRNLIGGLPWLN